MRKDGRFEARYAKGRDGNGKLIYGFCYGRTYEEAREKVRRAIRECSAGCIIGGKYTFSYYCNSWLMINGVCLKASSFAKYRTDLKNHIQPFFGDKVLYEITSDQVDRFSWMLLHEKNLSEKTVRNILTLFHSIYRYAKKRSGLNLSDLEIIYPKSPRKSVRVLDHQEEETLMEFLADEMDLCKFGVYMALRTGLRIGEVCALKWKDISMNTDTISVCRTVQRIKAPDEDTGLKTKLLVGELLPDTAAHAGSGGAVYRFFARRTGDFCTDGDVHLYGAAQAPAPPECIYERMPDRKSPFSYAQAHLCDQVH